MLGHERLVEESLRAVCNKNNDCTRYSMCLLANGCRCQSWGKCELVRIAGQPCITDPQCAVGLVCREVSQSTNNRCVPNNRLEDLSSFADLPDPGTPEEIRATYNGPLLVGSICSSLLLFSLAMTCWYRITAKTAVNCENFEMTSPSVIVDINTNQPLPNCASVNQLAPLHQSIGLPRELQQQ